MKIGGEGPRFELTPVNPERAPVRVAAPPQTAGPTFAVALNGIGGAVDRGERLMARVADGNLGGLDSAQLIALQAGIYRYSEAVDLVAKLVDRASSAVKTVISPHS